MKKIIKAIFKTGSASIFSILLGMLSTKIFAVILGPSGVGLYSLIRQILITGSTIGTMGGQTALVQGLASKTDKEKESYATTVFWLFLLGCILIAFSIVLFAPWIAKIAFASTDEHIIILVRWIALPTVLMVISIYLSSLLNGYRAIGRLAVGQVILALVTASLSYPVAKLVSTGYPETFIASSSISLISVIIFYLYVALKEKWLPSVWKHKNLLFDKKSFKHFYSMASTTLITATVTAIVLLMVRAIISQKEGLAAVGIFDAAWTLSMTYVMLLLGSFATYYMPSLSATNNPEEKILLMQQVLRITIILIVPLIVFIIILKPLLIHLLYSEKFIGALDIIRWMLIGDYLKVISFILAMPVLAYAEMKIFFLTELLWNIGFLIIVYIYLFIYQDLQGIGIAFMIMYILILLYYLYYAITKHQLKITANILTTWFIGLALILITSVLTWNLTKVNLAYVLMGILAIGIFGWFATTFDEKIKVMKLIKSKVLNHY